MASWGSTTLNILAGSYKPIFAKKRYTVIPLIPSSTDPDENVSITQDGGREPNQASFRCRVATLTEYNSFRTDYIAGTIRVFTGPNAETLTSIIFDLSPATQLLSDYFEFDVVVQEV